MYQTHAVYKWSGNVLQKAKIQYAALDALDGVIVGEQVYAISSDYKKTPPSVEEMQKCIVVRLLVENRNTVSAIGKIHQATKKRDYEARTSFTKVKVKVELILKMSEFQLLPQTSARVGFWKNITKAIFLHGGILGFGWEHNKNLLTSRQISLLLRKRTDQISPTQSRTRIK
jgi:phenylalanyl-tRNA synthetase beta subunit